MKIVYFGLVSAEQEDVGTWGRVVHVYLHSVAHLN